MSNHAPSTKQLLIAVIIYTGIVFSLGVTLGAVIWG